MTTKKIIAVVIYLAAIVLPTTAIAARFGFDTSVNLSSSREAMTQLFSMSGAIAAGFVCALAAGRLLENETDSLFKLTSRLISELRPKAQGQ